VPAGAGGQNPGPRAETVSYIAWQPSSGNFNKVGFVVDRTGRAITQNFTDILFTPPPATAPVFLGQMQTAYGKNSAGVEIRIAEETSYDAEIQHNPEVVGYMVFAPLPQPGRRRV
jgi:hypothetical protein